MIKLRSSKKTATFAPSAICNTRSQRKNSHFSPSRPSEVFRITTRAEDKHITNFGQDDGLAMHPASTAVIAQQAKDSRESLLPGTVLPGPEATQDGDIPGHQIFKILSPSPKP